MRGGVAESDLVSLAVTDDGDVTQAAERALRLLEMSIRCTRARRDADCSASARITIFSPLPHPSSTISGTVDVVGASRATIASLCRSSRRCSARVMRYHGSRQIASNSDEPSAS
jgi:hypothetical protein